MLGEHAKGDKKRKKRGRTGVRPKTGTDRRERKISRKGGGGHERETREAGGYSRLLSL